MICGSEIMNLFELCDESKVNNESYDTFDIKSNDSMYISKKNRINLW